MKYEAIESFSGIISMVKGEVRKIPNEALAKDLVNAKLIKEYVPTNSQVLKEELKKAKEEIEQLKENNKKLLEEIETLKLQNEEISKKKDSDDINGSSEENELSKIDKK